MRVTRAISEDEMIAVFLRGEIDSGRYGDRLREMLRRDGREERVLREPDPSDPGASAYRRRLLEEHRAYERRDGLFGGFPRDVEWSRALLRPEEVLDVLYIDWDWWIRLSGGTRSPRDAARRIRDREIDGVDVATHEPLAAALRAQPRPPELIVASTPGQAPLVLVEGHVRLTSYALFPECLPAELEVLLGVSPHMTGWCQF